MTKHDFKDLVKNGFFSVRWIKNNGEEGYIHRGILGTNRNTYFHARTPQARSRAAPLCKMGKRGRTPDRTSTEKTHPENISPVHPFVGLCFVFQWQ